MTELLVGIFSNGLTLASLFQVFILGMAIGAGLTVMNLIRREVAFKQVNNDPLLAEGAWMDFPTATGSVAGKIKHITRGGIRVELWTPDRGYFAERNIPIVNVPGLTITKLNSIPEGVPSKKEK